MPGPDGMVVFSNTAISLDGRIATAARERVALGSRTDLDYMSVLRARADAVLVGGATFRTWALPLVPDPQAIARLEARGFPDAEAPAIDGRAWINAVVTRTLELPRAGRVSEDPRVRPLFLSSAAGPAPARGELETADPVTVPWILDRLAARGVRRLLLEAGGDLLSQFLAAGALDELFVTICPRLVGGRGAPSLLDGAGFSAAAAPRLELLHLHRVGDELFARYRVNH